ncbi:di-trans,poly-cis-decaprenylcistransferase [Wenzhouxiangella sp. XN201]|uniref:di-trans,poly-cis-decaprenylcistransferase n=1 Tax=Wenzhouxiangella sp. XN201 TaxID=2710755 RepID=UPI0013C94583|nr:di-trans,poly-cis-decaprenylcistransferase [Wenzhouxiangella sp. XN201]NEZ03570.1 di-trans,poly-cis-decaprenylcistransferase [Wenzhouxiangella sp. XN201]
MSQSGRSESGRLHVAIIMDGNGRWAQRRGLPRSAGHRAGATAVRRVVEAAPAHGIDTLTLYAFSSDNWKRPAPEVRALLRLLEKYLRKELDSCIENDVSVEILGRRDRLPARVCDAIKSAERATVGGNALRLRLAIDYSSRESIARAAAHGPGTRAELARRLAPDANRHVPDVDLMIRTGGEQRLSDFLLWESAYAELYFTEVAWPDFNGDSLAAAVAEFSRRQRRFGDVEHIARTSALLSSQVR